MLAHVPAGGDAAAVIVGDAVRRSAISGSLEQIDADTADFSYRKLRKRERPFVMRLDPSRSGAGRTRRL